MVSNYPDWTIPSLGRLEKTLRLDELGPEEDKILFGDEKWKENLLEKLLQFLYPLVRFKEIKQGRLSGRQLGAILGHLYFCLQMVGPISLFVEKQCAILLTHVRALEKAKARWIAEATPLFQRTTLPVASAVLRISRLVLKAPIFLRFAKEIVPETQAAICTILGEAHVRGDGESQDLLASFQKAKGIRTLSPEGRILSRKAESQTTGEIAMVLFVLREFVRPAFKNAAQLHLAMVNVFLPHALTSDENDPKWEKQKRTVKWVCDSIGLQLAKRGRARKHK